MFVGFAIRCVATALALWVAVSLVSGVRVHGSWGTYLLVAVVFGLVNGTVGVALKFIGLPFIVLTLGLFLLVINAVVLALTAAFMDTFDVAGFGSAMLAALIVAIIGTPTSLVLRKSIGR